MQNKKVCYRNPKNVISGCDLRMANLGPTYRSKINGCQSELDHIYFSASLEKYAKSYLGTCGASDHHQIILELSRKKSVVGGEDKIFKFIRSYKYFDQSHFNKDLLEKPWEELSNTEDVNQMGLMMNKFLSEVYEKHVPLKN